MTLLDASKAFDRVQYVKLFRLLLEKGLCPLLILLLLTLYTSQSLVVKWEKSMSTPFSCTNGIKQGAVLSPVLFCCYMDELLFRLSQSRIGCHIGHVYAGAVSYADDLTLIAPCYSAAQELLLICEKFASEFHVKFNSTKSNVLFFKNVSSRPDPLH